MEKYLSDFHELVAFAFSEMGNIAGIIMANPILITLLTIFLIKKVFDIIKIFTGR
jgi:hypothetical protein